MDSKRLLVHFLIDGTYRFGRSQVPKYQVWASLTPGTVVTVKRVPSPTDKYPLTRTTPKSHSHHKVPHTKSHSHSQSPTHKVPLTSQSPTHKVPLTFPKSHSQSPTHITKSHTQSPTHIPKVPLTKSQSHHKSPTHITKSHSHDKVPHTKVPLTSFQMGTVALRASIAYCTAARESFRCTDDTAMITLASSTAVTPSRCTIAMRRTSHCVRTCGVGKKKKAKKKKNVTHQEKKYTYEYHKLNRTKICYYT